MLKKILLSAAFFSVASSAFAWDLEIASLELSPSGPFRIDVQKNAHYRATPSNNVTFTISGALKNDGEFRDCGYNVSWSASGGLLLNGADVQMRPISTRFSSSHQGPLLSGTGDMWGHYCGSKPMVTHAWEKSVDSVVTVKMSARCIRKSSGETVWMNESKTKSIQATVVCPGIVAEKLNTPTPPKPLRTLK